MSLSALSRFSIETGLPDPYPYSEQVSDLLNVQRRDAMGI